MVITRLKTSIVVIVVIFGLHQVDVNALQQGYYDYTCPTVEATVTRVLREFLASDRTLGGPLLRISYHDCFVLGCDASILLNGRDDVAPEKDARPNSFVRGYEVYDGIKAALEHECPGVVSCSDIIQLVARDVTTMNGGPSWNIYLGRRDGFTSSLTEAEANLLPPSSDFQTQKNAFAAKGLSEKDLVVLTGAHTLGRSPCASVDSRLYNFGGQPGKTDPALDEQFAEELKHACPSGSSNTLSMDGTPVDFDTQYFKRVEDHKGLFTSDDAMITETYPASIVNQETNKNTFFTDFPAAMINMANIGVLTGTNGQIRSHCAFVN